VSFFDLLLSDDSSTVGTPEICRRYMEKERPIRYVSHSENMGMTANQNHVLQESHGEYFM
jgi:glycosyltransferase involved in cell wall biosynthesis